MAIFSSDSVDMNGCPAFPSDDDAFGQCTYLMGDMDVEYEELKYPREHDAGGSLAVGQVVIEDGREHAEVSIIDSSFHAAAQEVAFGLPRLPYTAAAPLAGDYGSPPTTLSFEGAPEEDPPGMIRTPRGSVTSAEDAMSDEDESTAAPPAPRGVTFNDRVSVLPIPCLSDYTLEQKFRMYANRFELKENKLRNKKEYAYDRYDWRNATEEINMAICPSSGELLHPAHL